MYFMVEIQHRTMLVRPISATMLTMYLFKIRYLSLSVGRGGGVQIGGPVWGAGVWILMSEGDKDLDTKFLE